MKGLGSVQKKNLKTPGKTTNQLIKRRNERVNINFV